jgi:hypothetical protein
MLSSAGGSSLALHAELASTEQDPVKLLKLISEINDLLMEKESRLLNSRLSQS